MSGRLFTFLSLVIALSFACSGVTASTLPATPGTPPGVADGVPTVDQRTEESSGVRVTLTVAGKTAENVSLSADTGTEIRTTVASELGLKRYEVRVRQSGQGSGTVEVFSENVTDGEFVAALEAAGITASADQIRDGVTSGTLQQTRSVLSRRIQQASLSGGTVRIVETSAGTRKLVAAVPNATGSEARELLTKRGRVSMVAEYPVESDNGTTYRQQVILTQGDFEAVGPPRRGQAGRSPYVAVTLTDSAARRFVETVQSTGFTGQGVQGCRWQNNPADPGWCLYTVVDGERVYGASLSKGLAENIRRGEFTANPQFVLQTVNLSAAQKLKLDLETGALPAPVTVQSVESLSTETSTADSRSTETTPGTSGPGFGLAFTLLALVAVCGCLVSRRAFAE